MWCDAVVVMVVQRLQSPSHLIMSECHTIFPFMNMGARVFLPLLLLSFPLIWCVHVYVSLFFILLQSNNTKSSHVAVWKVDREAERSGCQPYTSRHIECLIWGNVCWERFAARWMLWWHCYFTYCIVICCVWNPVVQTVRCHFMKYTIHFVSEGSVASRGPNWTIHSHCSGHLRIGWNSESERHT